MHAEPARGSLCGNLNAAHFMGVDGLSASGLVGDMPSYAHHRLWLGGLAVAWQRESWEFRM